MIDIYNEIGYIKEVIENGFSEKWQRDAKLLIRYYKSQGMKKSEVKEKIKFKCIHSTRANYDDIRDYNVLNSILDSTWKKDVPLREIKEVRIQKPIIEWFLNLDQISLTTDQLAEEKRKRAGLSIKNNVFNMNRVKFLFTLYVWTKIQENYLERPNIHYLSKYQKRFKQDANLKSSFNLKKERNLMFDLGFINVNYALGIDTIFIDKFPVFKSQHSEDDYVLKGDDLYNCGMWIEKIKYGSFVCQNCGKEFAHYGNNKNENKRKYCKDCAKLLKNGNVVTRKIICIDCGAEVTIPTKANKSCRCINCQEKHDRELDRLYKLKSSKKPGNLGNSGQQSDFT